MESPDLRMLVRISDQGIESREKTLPKNFSISSAASGGSILCNRSISLHSNLSLKRSIDRLFKKIRDERQFDKVINAGLNTRNVTFNSSGNHLMINRRLA